jgi:hypothetical protein
MCEKLVIALLVKKILTFCGTQSFITMSTKSATGPWPELGESSHILLPSFCKISFNIILSF